MIFAGDVAIAPGDQFAFRGFPAAVRRAPWCVNLEGAIAQSGESLNWGLCNTDTWSDSFSEFRLGPVFLANNHVHDLQRGVVHTADLLRCAGLCSFGAGANGCEAAKPVAVMSGKQSYVLVGFGWPIIGCRPASNSAAGVNQLDGHRVKKTVQALVKEHPGQHAVVVMHWNYEFERYPQPGHRWLAMDLIDEGAYAVIGHHPHVVGPVERYRGRTIAYSLGNWAFSYGKHFGGRLKFPDSSFEQLAVELGEKSDVLHYARFAPPSEIVYERLERVADLLLTSRAPFEGATHQEYAEWFKANRCKKKLLPIYYDYEQSLSNRARDNFVGARQVLLDAAIRVGLKSLQRST